MIALDDAETLPAMSRARLSMSFSSLLLTSLALSSVGCGGDDVVAEGGEGTSSTSDPETGDGDGDAATGDGDGEGDGDGDKEPVCGDGELDPGEECDDGNGEEGDGCTAECVVSSCGLKWSTLEPAANGVEGARDTAIDEAGNVYAAGIIINDDNDAWVAKWGPDGTKLWAVSFDSGNGNDAIDAMVLDDAGNIYVTGWMEGSADDELWYAALDNDGAELWSVMESSGGGGNFDGNEDQGHDIALSPEGDVVEVGTFGIADGDDDVWVRKASASDGSEIWTSTWGGMGDNGSPDRGFTVAVAPNGRVWAGGREHVAFNSQEAVLLAFDSDGNFESRTQPRPSGTHTHTPVVSAASDDAVYFGIDADSSPFTGWFYKLGNDGSEQWVISNEDLVTVGAAWRVRGVGIDGNGNIGIGGVFTNEEIGESLYWGQAWTALLDADGNYLCRSDHMADDAFLPASLELNGASYTGAGFAISGRLAAAQGNTFELWTGFFLP